MIDANIGRAIQGLRSSIELWKPLSIMRRVALTKMVGLPEILYYYVNIPYTLPLTHYRELDTFVTSLIWNASRHRVALHTLKLPKDRGELGVPNFEYYHVAAQFE